MKNLGVSSSLSESDASPRGAPLSERTTSLIKRGISRPHLMSQKEKRSVYLFFSKSRNLIALSMFVAMLGRAVWLKQREDRVVFELLDAFDKGDDDKLSTDELTSLLHKNGAEFSKEQVHKLFGREDDEQDGFDQDELENVLAMISALPNLSSRLRTAAQTHNSLYMDIAFTLICGVGLAYLVTQTDNFERKWAASAFRSAVTIRRTQSKVSKLDADMKQLCVERSQLEEQIKNAQESNDEDEERRLKQRMRDVQEKQDAAQKALEEQVKAHQKEAEKCMREASLAKSKMEKVMACIRGMDAFAGAGGNKFTSEGAQQGFSQAKRAGFSAENITFGTIEDGQLLMYETSASRRLGEGRDGAYRCTDLNTGQEKALKMYKISSQQQRNAIFNDLFAHRSKVATHPRIVNYERVIESENTIFVLMELLSGMDLFDVVARDGLTEEQAKPLFLDLVEGVQHLHNNNVIHCDIKPENAVVVGSVKTGEAQVKLIDFGCSCFMSYKDDLASGSIVFDAYMPPEHALDPSTSPTVATDTWRLGCTLYIMLLRRPPFHNDAATPKGRAQREASIFPRPAEFLALSADAQDLVTKLLVGDPRNRLDTVGILAHPWAKGARPSTKLEATK